MPSKNDVRCPHGFPCEYVYTYTTVQGEQYVSGGNYWHSPDEKCKKKDTR